MDGVNKLHIDSVTKSYDNKVILSNVYLSCNLGEIKGLLGRNGSGKSTLLKIIFGCEKADSKFVRIGDKVINNVASGRNILNYLPQENFLPNNIKVNSLINLFLQPERRNSIISNRYVEPLLSKKADELSGGEKRIIEILLIINSSAPFTLLDEPFNGISPKMREYVLEYLTSLKTAKGIIITDHDYRNVINISDKLLFLKDAYLKAVKDKEELIELGYIPNWITL